MEPPEYVVTQKHHDGATLNYLSVDCDKCLSSFLTRNFELNNEVSTVTYKCPVCNKVCIKSYYKNKHTSFGRAIRLMLKDIKCSGHAAVGKSDVHGNGVFATEDIKKGEYICEYGGDVVTNEEFHNKYNDNLYALNISHNYLIIGHQVPKDSMKIGQLINDFATFDNEGTDIIEKYYFYKIKSMKGANVDFMRVGKFKMLIVALRDIKKGEELFVSYGAGYWNSSCDSDLYRKFKKDFYFYTDSIEIVNPDVKPGSKQFFEELKSMLQNDSISPPDDPPSEEEFSTENEDQEEDEDDEKDEKDE